MQQSLPINILVVDDREDNLLSIESILEKDHYNIIKANSGRAALKILLNRFDFSLILMDVQMPDMNGLETATLIYQRDRLKNIPIIFITAFSNDEDYLFKGYKMGGVDYIYKPINPGLLRAKVAVFVELYRKNEQLKAHEKTLIQANNSLQHEIEERRLSEEKIKLLNLQLLEKNNHLESVNEELDRFAYVASHDLQEPLRKIMMFSDKIISSGEDFNQVEKYLSKITNSSQRMQSLINNLLKFSRYALNASDFLTIDLNELVKTVISEMELDIDSNQVKVEFEKLPCIEVIPELMRQVFFNLINNAIKYRKANKPCNIRISCQRKNPFPIREKEKMIKGIDYYSISVKDNGIGFEDQYSEDIFMAFKRLHSFHEIEGIGVGLSICKKIIEKHHGQISAFGKLNEGATFQILLPEKQPKIAEMA
ncbi:MAG: sensor histidine kinase [Ginsengibacter sp.]|jgi:signal transduction histidine kinase